MFCTNECYLEAAGSECGFTWVTLKAAFFKWIILLKVIDNPKQRIDVTVATELIFFLER